MIAGGNEAVTQKRYFSVDLFRYFCALLIIGIHTALFSDISSTAHFYFLRVLSRIAVPFFFVTSGTFFIGKLMKRERPLKAYFLRQFTVYGIWSVIYFLTIFISDLRSHTQIDAGYFLKYLFQFCVTGIIDPFWFFPALLFAAAVSALFFRFRKEKLLLPFSLLLFIVGCLGTSWIRFGKQIPGLGDLYRWKHFKAFLRIFCMGIPFFSLGYAVECIRPRFQKLTDCGQLLLLGTAMILYVAETVFVSLTDSRSSTLVSLSLYPLTAVILLTLLRHPGRSASGTQLRQIATFTYLSHSLLTDLLLGFGNHFLSAPIPGTVRFAITVGCTALGGWLITKINNRCLNKLVL